ncbi:probable G-protein coupled receptor Mth-like 7 isoform X2 [Drosophila suzukii]|uniref:Probable G-protein coupled receptor Mth-like 7 isoform X2 n=1 Tax=Drosophila suzukii TaxID=28584 RepID=A0AB40DCZ9_DROSZ
MVISMICYVLSIAVYLYVKKLRNTLGKCIISSLFSIAIVNFMVILVKFWLIILVNAMVTYMTCVFFLSAYIAWLSAISYHIQKVFRTVKCGEHRHQFLVYSAFVWTTAATVTGVFYLIQNTRYECQKESKFAGKCLILGWLILSIFNIVKFIQTTTYIWKVKRELKRVTKQKETTPTCFNFDTQTYLQFLRLSVMMGLSWIFINLVWAIYVIFDTSSEWIQMFVLELSFYIGIFIFILLVARRSTLKLLKESFREKCAACPRTGNKSNACLILIC